MSEIEKSMRVGSISYIIILFSTTFLAGKWRFWGLWGRFWGRWFFKKYIFDRYLPSDCKRLTSRIGRYPSFIEADITLFTLWKLVSIGPHFGFLPPWGMCSGPKRVTNSPSTAINGYVNQSVPMDLEIDIWHVEGRSVSNFFETNHFKWSGDPN